MLFNCTLGPEGVTVQCFSSLDQTLVPITYTCSYDGGPQEDCQSMHHFSLLADRLFPLLLGGPGPEIALPLGRFTGGAQVRVEVTLSTNGGQTDSDTVTFVARGRITENASAHA